MNTSMKQKEPVFTHEAQIATYNLKVGRVNETRRMWLIKKIKTEKLKVVMLQEADGYNGFLKAVAKACNMDLYQVTTGKDSGNNAVLIGRTIDGDQVWRQLFQRANKMWWGAKTKTWRAPRVFVAGKAGGVWWGSGHRVAYQYDPRNVAANVDYDRVVASAINSRPRARWVVAMDWNDGSKNEDVRLIAERVDGKLANAKKGGIDFFMYVDGEDVEGNRKPVEVDHVVEVEDKGGSDHHMRIARARW